MTRIIPRRNLDPAMAVFGTFRVMEVPFSMRFSPSTLRVFVSIPLIAVLSACDPVAPDQATSAPTIGPVASASPKTEAVSEVHPRESLKATPTASSKMAASPVPSATATAKEIMASATQVPNPSPTAETEERTMQVTLEVPGKAIQVSMKEQGTAYDLLMTAQKKGLITFSGRQFSGVGFFVEEIDGLRQNGQKGMYWLYAVNGTKAHVGVSSSVLKEGDRVTFTYEAAN